MRKTVKKIIIILLDIALAVYLVFAMTSFNTPDESGRICTKVAIQIEDKNSNGFLSSDEIKNILVHNRLYPLNKKITDINPRDIEELLMRSPFIKTAECYKDQNNHVSINITQQLPIIRIKNIKGEDYYLDERGGIMPNTRYVSDLIIATGSISKWYAKAYLTNMARVIMNNDMWNNLIVQINILPDLGVEVIPRIGNHAVYLGSLPQSKNAAEREKLTNEFINNKLTRLEKFYKYGLNEAGWNKYSYINLEFDNQIICKKQNKKK